VSVSLSPFRRVLLQDGRAAEEGERSGRSDGGEAFGSAASRERTLGRAEGFWGRRTMRRLPPPPGGDVFLAASHECRTDRAVVHFSRARNEKTDDLILFTRSRSLAWAGIAC
jgi:hypothetical protein